MLLATELIELKIKLEINISVLNANNTNGIVIPSIDSATNRKNDLIDIKKRKVPKITNPIAKYCLVKNPNINKMLA